MPIGDIKVSNLKIGNLDLSNPSQASYASVDIYEDILNPYGPSCEIVVIDQTDALGKNNINGSYDQDIQISFSQQMGSGSLSFKFKLFENKNMKDGAATESGTGRYKEYVIRGVSPELLSAQGNYVQKSYEEQTSKIVEDILKKNFKTDKQVEIKENTKSKRRFVFGNEHPLKALQKLNTQHVAASSKSSAFVLFQQNTGSNQKYIFTTFEKLFEESPVVKLKQSSTLGASGTNMEDMQNSIRWIDVADSFYTPSRALNKPQEIGYDSTTGRPFSSDPKTNSYSVADGKTSSKGVFSQAPSNIKNVPVVTRLDATNEKDKTSVSEGRKNRTEFVSYLTQNYGSLEIIGNPKIKLGSMIELEIPKKAVSEVAAGEKQFNGKALVVSIRHKINPIGTTPRYTMILGVVKGSYKEGGGGNG